MSVGLYGSFRYDTHRITHEEGTEMKGGTLSPNGSAAKSLKMDNLYIKCNFLDFFVSSFCVLTRLVVFTRGAVAPARTCISSWAPSPSCDR